MLCVVGAGAMGGQIAHQAAVHHVDVRLYSRTQPRLEAAVRDASAVLRRRVEKGKLTAEHCEAALARVTTGTDLGSALDGADVVIESVVEDRETKHEVLRAISEHASENAIIGTNSSTLPSSLLAASVRNPERFLNMHFFNPPLQMPLVEVVQGPHTSQATVQGAFEFTQAIGKTPVLVRKEAYGFVVNRILFIAMQEAFRLIEEGIVSIDDCDTAVRSGLGWPMGVFELADLISLDVVKSILAEGLAQTGEERWRPKEMLRERVARGELGRKTGGGFTSGANSA